MKRAEIRLLQKLSSQKSFEELIGVMNKSKSFISKICKGLLKKGLIEVRKENGKRIYSLSKNPKAILILRIINRYPKLLEGKKELALKYLIKDIELKKLQIGTGISLKQLIEYLKEMKSYGIVIEKNKKYSINPEKYEVYQLAQIMGIEEEQMFWKKDGEYLKISREKEEGSLTAFSVFSDFDLIVFPNINYYYFPKKKLSLEEIFVHSLVFAQTYTEKILSALFYLKHKDMDKENIFSLAKRFDVTSKLYDLIDFTKGKEVKDFGNYMDLVEKARNYGIGLEKKVSSKDYLVDLFEQIDEKLKRKTKLYLFGGANMIIRNLKISTKDVDILVKGEDYEKVRGALLLLNFSFSKNIFEKNDYRIDLFKDRVLGGYFFSKNMIKNSEPFWIGKKLSVYLLSMEYVLLFKSYSGREIDLEDCRILAEQGLDWNLLLKETIYQQEKIEKIISLTLLDILDELKERYRISTPIIKKLDSYVLRKLLLVTLSKPMSTKEIVKKFEKPEPTIRKVLHELIKSKKIKKIKKDKKFLFESIRTR